MLSFRSQKLLLLRCKHFVDLSWVHPVQSVKIQNSQVFFRLSICFIIEEIVTVMDIYFCR